MLSVDVIFDGSEILTLKKQKRIHIRNIEKLIVKLFLYNYIIFSTSII